MKARHEAPRLSRREREILKILLCGGEMAGLAFFRDQALARVTSEPPDPEFGRPERHRWRVWVARLALTLDGFHTRGQGGELACRVLVDAFRLFLPLADPGWWRVHPTLRLNAAARRELRSLDKKCKRAARRAWAGTVRAAIASRLVEASAVFLRRGDAGGMARCRRLSDVMKGDRLPDAGASGEALGGALPPGIPNPAAVPTAGRRHNAGPGAVPGSGKEFV